MIHDSRIKTLCDAPPAESGAFVLYWMQASQRAEDNAALEYAIDVANTRGLPVVVAFVLMPGFWEANARSYAFMLEGLAEIADTLAARNIHFVFKLGDVVETVARIAAEAAIVVTDRGYLRYQREWRARLTEALDRRLVQVECESVVPLEVASTKLESGARTIRPKITRALDDHLGPLNARRVETNMAAPPRETLQSDLDPRDLEACLTAVKADRSVAPVSRFKGGLTKGYERLDAFLDHHLDGYKEARSDPAEPSTSEMSPYLHLGQVSPVEIVRRVRERAGGGSDAASYVEELVVRRELAQNFTSYQPAYGSWAVVPDWAKATLREHSSDERPARYTIEQLEAAETDDPYWNAAMKEMLKSGYTHNYMRMYWGKQFILWMEPEEAFEAVITLNNKYFLDGRDPNSYSNTAWIFGVHDRPWPTQPLFGKVRSMKASGLKRKFRPDDYVRWVDALEG